MVHKRSNSIISICMTLMLVFLLAFPLRVFAQDEAPTATPDPEMTVPTVAPVVPTVVVTEVPTEPLAEATQLPTEPSPVVTDVLAVPLAATDVPVEPTPVVTEVPAGPLAETTQLPTEPSPVVTDVPADPLVATDVSVENQVAVLENTETPVVIDNPTPIADTVTALQDAGAMLVDAAGNPIPLASQEAADILVAPDPIGCPSGVTPTWNSVTDMAAGCTAAYSSIQVALDDPKVIDGEGWTIFIQQGNYAEDVVVSKSVKFTGQGTGATATSITLNKDIDNLSSWFSSMLVIVNSGASISDGLNLLAPGGTVKTTVKIEQGISDSTGYTAKVKDKSNDPGSPYYQLECGEPNVSINLTQTYKMTLMDPTNPIIVAYYGLDATQELHDLCIAVNAAQYRGWDQPTQQQVYWQVLNKIHPLHPCDATCQSYVDKIKNGDYDSDPKSASVFFMVPSDDGTPAPSSAQLTFIKTCDDGNPTTTDFLNAIDGSCSHRTKVCNDANAQTNDVLNADGTCSFTLKTCDDKNPQTLDALNGDGTCSFTLKTCDDESPRTQDVLNADGTCSFTLKNCDDQNLSTIDVLNTDGTCSNTLIVCNDNNANTIDTLVNGECVYTPNTPPTTPPLTIVPLLIPVTGNTCVPDVITAGIGHTCAVTPETGLRCWGQNDTGQLGNGQKAGSTIPVNVKVLDGSEVVQLVSGTKHTCALTAGNDVMCWGLNYSGQLGDGTTTNSNIPVKVKGLEGTIISISAGENFTCAVNSANITMCWGNNSGGQFKNGNTNSTSTPVVANLGNDVRLVSGGQSELQGVTNAGAVQFWSNQPTIPVTGLSSDVALVSADRFSEGGCAMTTEGKVECWGAITASEITDAKVPTELETGKKTCKVDPLITGEGHGCTITKDNGLVCWGKNVYGQLGNGTQTDSEAPVEVTGIRNVIHLAAGFDHTCAIVDQETIKCWGQNTYGQLGNGTSKESSLPVLVK